jgi:hypothetical protein
MCTTGVFRLASGGYALFKNKDFGRAYFDDRVVLEPNVFGVSGTTSWAGVDPSLDQFSGFSVGANSSGLLCCDSNVVTLDSHVNYDIMVEVALREGTNVESAILAVKKEVAKSPTSWGNMVLIDQNSAASIEIRGTEIVAVPLTGANARTNHHLSLGDHELQEDKTTTVLRFNSASKRLAEVKSVSDVFGLLKSHDDGDTGVCNHALHTTVYSYVLVRENNETTLHVSQGQPCLNNKVIVSKIPFGSLFSSQSADEFIANYPSANKANFGVTV